LNPIEHVGDMLSHRVQAVEPPVLKLPQLEAALHGECRQLPQQHILRLTGGMRRRAKAVIQARGGFTRY
jgi:hypothetical protein